MATTCPSTPPPASTTTYTPSTPRYGTFGDDYQPYSPPRKSARIGLRARAAYTPEVQNSPSTPRSSNRGASSSHDFIATPKSPQTAQKKRVPRSSPRMGGRRVSGALDFDSTAFAASALGLPTPTQPRKMELPRQSASRNDRATGNGMLPTPAKTPSRSSNISSSAIKSVQRNIFPSRGAPIDEMMPTPKRRDKKGGGFTINSFESDDVESPIPIYTDSMDRVPSPDTTSDNPFASNYRPSPVATRTRKRGKIEVQGEGEMDLDEILGRSDGTLVNFRGRKLFKKFDEPACASSTDLFGIDDTNLDAEIAAHLPNYHGPVTRSVKPRLLFASAEQIEEREERLRVNEEEEALTDIEVDMKDVSPVASSSRSRTFKNSISFSANTTPGTQSHGPIATPKAPRFSAAIATPPTTARITRSKDADMTTPPSGRGTDSESPRTPTRTIGDRAESVAQPFNHPQVSKKRVGQDQTGSPAKRARR